jgi:hypothetical protein
VGHQVPETLVHSYQTALGHAPEDGTVLIVFVCESCLVHQTPVRMGYLKEKWVCCSFS